MELPHPHREASPQSVCRCALLRPICKALQYVRNHTPAAAARRYAPIADHLAFYATSPFRCFVDEELVTPQPGGFYGGWITSNLEGPFKGGPGSMGW